MATLGRPLPPGVVAWAVLACGGEPPADSPSADRPEAGGTAIVAFNSELRSFNPLVATDLNTIEVNSYMLFTPLVQYDETYEPRPYLASSWELDETGVTFHLNRDARWHDGRPVSAHDVEFTFARAKDPETASVLSSAYLAMVESAEVIDSFTIRFRFTRPHARPLDGFWWPPLPKHLLSDVPPAQLVHTPFNRQPVGSGPFKFVRWESGQHVVLERNAEFPASLGGPPELSRVIIRFIPEPATLLSETLTGRIDVNGSVYPHQAEQLERGPRTRLLSFPSREYYYIGWNTRNPLLSDRRVRRALTMSLDREQLIEALVSGYARLATGTIAPWHPMYTEIEPLPYDAQRASALLAEAGWRDRDGDGVLEDEGGIPFRFTLMTNQENPVRVDIAQVVQAQLAERGIEVEVLTLEWGTVLSRHRTRDFEGVVQSWVLDNFRVDPAALFHSSQADQPGSYNRSGLKDDRVDALIEAAMGTTDPARARELWAEFSEALQKAQPFTFLMWLDELAAISNRISGVRMDARGVLVTVADWWIPAALRER